MRGIASSEPLERSRFFRGRVTAIGGGVTRARVAGWGEEAFVAAGGFAVSPGADEAPREGEGGGEDDEDDDQQFAHGAVLSMAYAPSSEPA